MKVRFPQFDFSRFNPHWAPNPEFAQSYNAFSTVPAHIEPYLVKVMRKAKEQLDPRHTELHEEVSIFIKQEVQHCKQHVAFNRRLHENGYEGMLPIEQVYKDDYDRYLNTRSLKFNLAYCEGFEAMGCSAAEVMFEDLGEFTTGADGDSLDLWRWHLAEEFEHREVCYKVFKAIYGQGLWNAIVNGWLYRIYGLYCALKHIGAHTRKVAAYMIEKDREQMTPQQRAESVIRQQSYQKAVKAATLPRLAKVLSPFYDPAKRRTPRGMQELLARFPQTPSAAVRQAA